MVSSISDNNSYFIQTFPANLSDSAIQDDLTKNTFANAMLMAFASPDDPKGGIVNQESRHSGNGDMSSGAFGALLAALAAYLFYKKQNGNNNQPQRNEFTAYAEEPKCNAGNFAANYLTSLKKERNDQLTKSIPLEDMTWNLPGGYRLSTKQQLTKDGLQLRFLLSRKDAKDNQYHLINLPKYAISQKGTEVEIYSGNIPPGYGPEGKVNITARVATHTGVNEIKVMHTKDKNQYVIKLKPGTKCDSEIWRHSLYLLNSGDSVAALKLVNNYLAAAARENNHTLTPGLFNLLMHIRPDQQGYYRNHGSEALDVITRPLNALSAVGVDLATFAKLQVQGNKSAVVKWLQNTLQVAITAGRISGADVANPFGLNLGVPALMDIAPDKIRNQQNSVIDPRFLQKNPANSDIEHDILSVSKDRLRQALAHHGVPFTEQLNNGRVFIPLINTLSATSESQPDINKILADAAAVFGIKPNELWQHAAYLTRNKIKWSGIVVEPRTSH